MKNKKAIPETTGNIRKVLLDCLQESGEIIARNFGKIHDVQHKSPISIVTETDLAAEKKSVSIIKKAFPTHRLLTEESAPINGTSNWRWIIDPLDGTTNYSHHVPICAVSIGVECNGQIVMGGIYNPISREIFFTERGQGSWLNAKQIYVSKTSKMIESLLVTGFPYDSQKNAEYYLTFVQTAIKKSQGIRRLGAAAIDLAYVACGKFDAFWEFNLKPWDVAAGILMVEEAGGKVTRFDGSALSVDKPSQLLASNSEIHSKILKIFKPLLRK